MAAARPTVREARALASVAASASGAALRSLDLLPYHKLARAKYEALGCGGKWWDAELMPDDQVQSAAKLMRSYNLTVRIVGDRSGKETP